ncbi:MAG: hypothetical protein JSR99_14625 [Proteobacteria bacterium]|nr:hypothetical protein [Pseudomonadota bacterium]
MSLSLAFAGIGIISTGVVALRGHQKTIAARQSLLDRCVPLLSGGTLKHGGDGFPILEGYRGGRFVRIELVPDSMTIRRLPQLWLKLTRLEARPQCAEFSLLVRPSGTEFYSLTSEHRVALDPPAGIAAEAIAKGDRSSSQRAVDRSSAVLRRIFADVRAKEVAVTKRGLRLIWQAAEGHRGEHLLFRQCRFENAELAPSDLENLFRKLDDLGSSLDQVQEARAA